jgi:hypothetical protein
MEIAREALEQVIQHDHTAGVARTAHSNRWRAYSAGWSYEGDFVAAVASLALHVSDLEEQRQGSRAPHRRPPGPP